MLMKPLLGHESGELFHGIKGTIYMPIICDIRDVENDSKTTVKIHAESYPGLFQKYEGVELQS